MNVHAAHAPRTYGAPKIWPLFERNIPVAREEFTAHYLRNLSSKGEAQTECWDAHTAGLSIRVTKAGKKTWTFTYTSPRDGKRARISMGTFPATELKRARELVIENRTLVEAGTDPRDIVTDRPKTIAELIEERLEMEVKNQIPPVRTANEIERRHRKYVIPLVGDVAVAEFRVDPHYNKVIDPLVRRRKLRQAGQVHTDLMTLMKFAMRRGVIEYSRLAATVTPDPKNVRKRFLSVPEIRIVWLGLPSVLALSKKCQRILKLCLVLGQRLGEVSGMARAELDLQRRLWTIPKERVKNGDKYGDHVVPLSDLAMEIIRDAMRDTNGDWIFPNEEGNGPLEAHVIATTVRRATTARPGLPLGKFGVAKWTPHDLRRTVGTQMLNKENGLEIAKVDKYLVLNHRSATKGNVSDDVYDQNEYLEEKRAALDKWGAFLAKLVGEEIEQREAA